MIGRTTDVPVRRRRSIFSIIGMIVVGIVLLVLAYFAYVGWTNKGRPVPDVDVKKDAVNLPVIRGTGPTTPANFA